MALHATALSSDVLDAKRQLASDNEWLWKVTVGLTACDRKQLNAIRHVSAQPWRSGKAGNSKCFYKNGFLFTRLFTRTRFSGLVLRSENSRSRCSTGTSAT